MIPDQPDSSELLRTAASVLKQEIIPALPENKRLDALMVLAVLGSAERDLDDGGGLAQRQSERLSQLLPGGGSVQDLCHSISKGSFDEAGREAVLRSVLMEDVLDRLALVNPKYLANIGP